MSNPSFNSIISPIGNVVEQLEVDIIPHEKNNNEYDEVPESPRELIGQSLNFKIVIIGAKDLPANFMIGQLIQLNYIVKMIVI